MNRLLEKERQRVTIQTRNRVIEDMRQGVPSGSRFMCQKCDYAKPLAGAVRYGEYQLCNDCALQYALSNTNGGGRNIEDFMAGLIPGRSRPYIHITSQEGS